MIILIVDPINLMNMAIFRKFIEEIIILMSLFVIIKLYRYCGL